MKNSSFLILVLLTVLLAGCGGKNTHEKQEPVKPIKRLKLQKL